MRAATLGLPEEVDNKLQLAMDKGRAATKVELIRKEIDGFIERHPDYFSH